MPGPPGQGQSDQDKESAPLEGREPQQMQQQQRQRRRARSRQHQQRRALVAGVLSAAEVTFRTAAAEDAIKAIAAEVPEMLLGAGTVITDEQADRALAAGCTFLVSPGFIPELTKYVIDKGGLMMVVSRVMRVVSRVMRKIDFGIW